MRKLPPPDPSEQDELGIYTRLHSATHITDNVDTKSRHLRQVRRAREVEHMDVIVRYTAIIATEDP